VSPRTVDFDALPTTPVTLDADCVGCHRAAVNALAERGLS